VKSGQNSSNIRLSPSLLFLLLVFVVAVVGARLSCMTICRMRPSHEDAHDWIHTQLGLTLQQDAALAALESVR
jgi:hypothetical protein